MQLFSRYAEADSGTIQLTGLVQTYWLSAIRLRLFISPSMVVVLLFESLLGVSCLLHIATVVPDIAAT